MTTDSTSLGKLALSSMRLNRGVLILVGVAVVLVGTCAWALQRLLDVEVNKVDYHFSRLVESLNENRLFLSNVNTAVNDAQDVLTKNITPLQSRLVFHGAGVNIYEGKEFSFSTPLQPGTKRRERDG
jgi:two-component system, NarL family, capsular synthesis sensor histidine kinase RcsC